MIPIRDNLRSKGVPLVTYTLIGLNVLIYLWDRHWSVFGPSLDFADLAVRPVEIVAVLGGGGDTRDLVTLFTCMFLHGGIAHLLGNMLFLLTFGPNVEIGLGPWRYTLYYLFWGIMASGAHIFVMPTSAVPALGASGAIGGILGCYLLLFPSSRITFIVPPFLFYPFIIPAWIMLGLWFVFQVAFPQAGVANWAHAGGFLAGMLTVLVAGGRARLLKDVRFEQEPDPEYA
jgi:membrane associated rhomboid family serine protease